MSNQEPLLKVEHLCQYFKAGNFVTKAVDDVSFDIKKGEVFGLVGESGCGKTTTGRSIIKLYNITSGNIIFKGQRIAAGTQSYKDAIKEAQKELKGLGSSAADQEKKEKLEAFIKKQKEEIKSAQHDQKHADKKLVTQIQMIFQDPIASLDPRMTVREIISEGLVIQGEKDKKVIDQKVYEMLELVGLVPEHASRYPHEFSGGQRQRIGIARSLILQPKIIVCDEAVSALDVSIQAQIINLLEDLQREFKLTYLFISHALSVVRHISDRVLVMYLGRAVEFADTEDLFSAPLHPYTKALLSAAPHPDPDVKVSRIMLDGEVPNPADPPTGCHFHPRCPYKTARCEREYPPFEEHGKGHFAACWNLSPDGEGSGE